MNKLALAVLVAACFAVTACAGGALQGLSPLAAALGPQLRDLLGPEVSAVLNLVQSRGAVVLEEQFAGRFNRPLLTIGAGVSRDQADAILTKAAARWRLLEQLRDGNDYTQFVLALSPPQRERLDAARWASDRAYVRLLDVLRPHADPLAVQSAMDAFARKACRGRPVTGWTVSGPTCE